MSLPPDRLREACFELIERYAAGVPGPHITTNEHRHAYIASRVPATYGVIRQIFRRLQGASKSIHSLLDLGSGIGSLGWAAKEAFPQLKSVMLVEEDLQLLRLPGLDFKSPASPSAGVVLGKSGGARDFSRS